ncbi:hypothetical protein DFA_07940 [Cavenderia fasciculata]|uniref:DNA endonuclease activator Ctp1 C-terminal domain-containing protein n=1 Tax=Cavenderia fasciculata TaxID=261658 RepID=F4Q497_CACFS|nr:uncharacterized protein DFA_07940 [Cavenderia fasciculata]EGG16959.1 hypothetical protein DFA_07940 [Cavenderia fasciculata]|eukprot:XP_004355433.1 hypothetical protein DFA_07940 [Cavenderia fasciculata]
MNNREDSNNDENENDTIVCSQGIRNAINLLLREHTIDILKVENEFQQQKMIWEQEKDMLLRACKKLKDQNEALKNQLRLFISEQQVDLSQSLQQQQQQIPQQQQQQQQTPPSQQPQQRILPASILNANNNSNDKASPKFKPKSTTTTTPKQKQHVVQQQQSDDDDGFVSKHKHTPTQPTSAAEQSDSATPNDNNGSSKKKAKKRKSNDPATEQEIQDELDLSMTYESKQDQDDDPVFAPGNFTRIDFKKYSQQPNNEGDDDSSITPTQQKQKKKHKVVDVIRNQEERQQLQGYECEHCKEFYDAVLGDDYDKKLLLNQCSRHRKDYTPPSTPPGFWDFSFGEQSPIKSKINKKIKSSSSSNSDSKQQSQQNHTSQRTKNTNNKHNVHEWMHPCPFHDEYSLLDNDGVDERRQQHTHELCISVTHNHTTTHYRRQKRDNTQRQ